MRSFWHPETCHDGVYTPRPVHAFYTRQSPFAAEPESGASPNGRLPRAAAERRARMGGGRPVRWEARAAPAAPRRARSGRGCRVTRPARRKQRGGDSSGTAGGPLARPPAGRAAPGPAGLPAWCRVGGTEEPLERGRCRFAQRPPAGSMPQPPAR